MTDDVGRPLRQRSLESATDSDTCSGSLPQSAAVVPVERKSGATERKRRQREREALGIAIWKFEAPLSVVRDGLLAGGWLLKKDRNDAAKVQHALQKLALAALRQYLASRGATRDINKLNTDEKMGEMLRRESTKRS